MLKPLRELLYFLLFSSITILCNVSSHSFSDSHMIEPSKLCLL